MTFLPGRPLPADPQASSERTLYHAQRTSGEMGTMTREGGTWQWRLLRSAGPDAYGNGGWNDLKTWLSK